MGVIRQAFSTFDKEGKGFVSATDISRVLTESGDGGLSEEVRRNELACRFFAAALTAFLSFSVAVRRPYGAP